MRLIRTLLSSCLIAICHASVTHPVQQPISSTPLLRNATITDAEAITSIILEAFFELPYIKYLYQFADDYPQDRHDCMYIDIHAALLIPDVLTQVALLPDNLEPHELVPVAVAIWSLPTLWQTSKNRFPFSWLLNPLASASAECKHRDLNMTRAQDWVEQFSKADHLDDIYPPSQQFYLNTLATHPDYQRHGAGGALVNAGLALGRKAYEGENVTATLIATEAGEPLYAHLEWESIDNFTISSLDEVDGKREEWRFDVMTHELR